MSVPDIAKARAFYIDLLGAEEISAFGWHDNALIDGVVGLPGSRAEQFIARLGNTQIEVFEYAVPRSPPQDADRGVHNFGYTHFALQVDDVMAVYERMCAAGIRFHAAPDPTTIVTAADGGKTGYSATYGRDFFGNAFEIMEIHTNAQILPI